MPYSLNKNNQLECKDNINIHQITKYPFYGIVGEKKVLVTGSGWYKHIPAGYNNNSQIVAENLHGTIIEGAEIVATILPNMWDFSIHYINEVIQKVKPILIISIGTENIMDLRLEKYATNLAYGIDYADNPKMKGRIKDNIKEFDKILDKGPDLYEAILPEGLSIDDLVQILLRNGIPTLAGGKTLLPDNKRCISTAGYYLCNYFAYMILHYINSHKLTTKYLFVHIPTQPEYRAISLLENKEPTPAMELDLVIKGIKLIIKKILQFMKY